MSRSEKRNGADSQSLSPEVAWFLSMYAKEPSFIRVDKYKGGLSNLGEKNETKSLLAKISPALTRISGNDQISESARKFSNNLDLRGSVYCALSSDQRKQLFVFLESNGCNLTDFEKKILLTTITF